MLCNDIFCALAYSHAYMYTAPDVAKTDEVYNKTLALVYSKQPDAENCYFTTNMVVEMFSPMGLRALMIGHSNDECMGLTVCDGMTYNKTVMRNGMKTDVWHKEAGIDDNGTVYVDANTGIPYESVW